MPARILLIEPDAILADKLHRVLEGARDLSADTRLASSGQEGLLRAKHEGFDVAVVNVTLPDTSGVDLLRPLRRASAPGEVVLVAAVTAVDRATAALRSGAFGFVLDSCRPEELIATVAQALEKVTRERERRAAGAVALDAMAPLALGLAHGIRTSLNAAVLELHLLGRGIERLPDPAVRDPMKRRVGVVEGEIKRLERLLNDFLDLARPRAPHREPVDLARLLSELLELESEAIASRRVTVERAAAPGCAALGDVEKLKQAAQNLVENALEVMPDGGTLSVAVGADPGEVWLAIGDTGPGVDPAIVGEIFDPFFTTKAGGAGLGLAIVRQIVEQHRGRVEVETEKDAGTTVRVVLPRAG